MANELRVLFCVLFVKTSLESCCSTSFTSPSATPP